MINENIAASFGMPEITVISDYSITPEIAEKCYNMGEVTYYSDTLVDLQTYKNKFHAVPDFCFVFMHKETNQPVGYFIILPLTDDAIMRYMKNQVSFNTLKPSDLQSIEPEQFYNLYFDTDVLYKQYRTQEMKNLLFSLIANAMIEHARNFSFCNYILIDGYKDFSKVLAKSLNTKYLTTHKYDNGVESDLYGETFDYAIFEDLQIYSTIEFAYNNLYAKRFLKEAKDLWQECKTHT